MIFDKIVSISILTQTVKNYTMLANYYGAKCCRMGKGLICKLKATGMEDCS